MRMFLLIFLIAMVISLLVNYAALVVASEADNDIEKMFNSKEINNK